MVLTSTARGLQSCKIKVHGGETIRIGHLPKADLVREGQKLGDWAPRISKKTPIKETRQRGGKKRCEAFRANYRSRLQGEKKILTGREARKGNLGSDNLIDHTARNRKEGTG